MPRETLGELEQQILLVILQCGGESYSVQVVEELEQRTGRGVSQAAVFIVLRRLEEKGLLASRLDEPADAPTGRVRRYFSTTPLALERLRASRRALLELWDGLEEVLSEP